MSTQTLPPWARCEPIGRVRQGLLCPAPESLPVTFRGPAVSYVQQRIYRWELGHVSAARGNYRRRVRRCDGSQ